MIDPHRVINHLTRTDFLFFANRAFMTLNPGSHIEPAEYLQVIRYALGEVEAGECKRLLVTIPPRHLKSHLINVAWTAWLLGRHPSTRIISASYGLDLSYDFSAATRKVMESEWYGQAFPNVLDPRAKSREDLRTRKGGRRFATSVGGTITGFGGSILIVDDPLSATDAFSSATRTAAWDWFEGTLMSRIDDRRTGAIVVVAQRLHEEDIPGRLLEKEGWTHINLPIVALDTSALRVTADITWSRAIGELLHPARMGPKEIDQLKKEISKEVWEAQYMQRPAPPGGYLFDLTRLKKFDLEKTPRKAFEAVIISVDTALATTKMANYSAITVWGIYGDKVCLLDANRGRYAFEELVLVLSKLETKHQADRILIEQAASGHMLIEHLRRHGAKNVLAYNPKDDKIARAHAVTPKIDQGLVCIPHSEPGWLAPYLNELSAFPNGSYDDWVDSTTQFLRSLDYGYSGLDLSVYGQNQGRVSAYTLGR